MGVLSSYLLSHIIKPSNPVQFSNLKEMVIAMKENRVHIIETHRTRVESEIKGIGKTLGINMTKVAGYNPIRISKNTKEALAMLREPGSVIIRYDDEDMYYQAVEDCDVITKEEVLPLTQSSFIFNKGFPLLPAINRVIREETLEIRRLQNKYKRNFKEKISCKAPAPQKTGKRTIKHI
uniref:DUF362 domain-containing protein n=2 Tax=Bursaphelenchus xylophilus TaxID=6326 RepID=A0A1I7SH81_BURXY